MRKIDVIYLENARDFGYNNAWVYKIGPMAFSSFSNNWTALGYRRTLEEAKQLVLDQAPNTDASPKWQNGDLPSR